MGLIDLSTLLISLLATMVVTFGTALFWRKIFRKGFANLAIRLLLILLCQVLALTSMGLAVNRSNGFFESWSDLFGTGTNYSSVAVKNTELPRLNSRTLGKGSQLRGGAVMINDVIKGVSSGVSNNVYLYLPREIVRDLKSNRAIRSDKFKVVEFLTGFPSQPIMWLKVMKIDQILASYNVLHPNSQILGVFPQVNVAGNYDLECMNLPNGKPKAESWLAEDMHAYLAKRIGFVKPQWSIMGLSTGGWCAAMLSLKHPQLFNHAVSIAGYYRPALPLTDPIALQNWAKKNYPLDKFERQLAGGLRIYIVASTGDKYSFKETKKFLRLNHPKLDITYRELASGGHNPHVWIPAVKPALNWL